MSLIVDHINGIADDNRLENLRIVCPNCNATLDTHCGRDTPTIGDRACERCGATFRPQSGKQGYCSRDRGIRWDRKGNAIRKWVRFDEEERARSAGEAA